MYVKKGSCGAGAQSVTVKATGCEVKRGVKFRHSTRNASRIRRKLWNRES